jgi:HmuY protein
MKRVKMVFVWIAATSMVTACSKSTDQKTVDTTNDGSFKVFTQGNVTTVQNLVADTIIGFAPNGQPFGNGKFSFFSLENKTLVANTDSASSKWDIAFRGTTILVNSGSSGPGNAGAFVQLGAFDDIKIISPDSVFRVDAAPVYAIRAGSNNSWYNYNAPVNLLTPLPGRVLVIRTAAGKYAKMEILNYYKGGTTPSSTASDDDKIKKQRFYNFRFQYQTNGSKQF